MITDDGAGATGQRPTAAPDAHQDASAVVVMGVSGSGKTTVAQALAQRLGWTFAEADDFHPRSNIEKMEAGEPLDDQDRAPWLASIRDWLTQRSAGGESAVITCSALKRAYRDELRGGGPRVAFLHLTGDRETLAQRMSGRSGHFMPGSLLDSQLSTLEPLQGDEDGVQVSILEEPDQIVERAVTALHLA